MRKNRIFIPAVIVLLIMSLSLACSSCIGRGNDSGDSGAEQEVLQYVELKNDSIPFRFEMSSDARFIIRTNDSITYFCDIIYPETTAHFYCTFRFMTPDKLEQLQTEAARLAYNHLVASSSIVEKSVSNTYGVHGIVYDLGGEAATPYQIAITDGASFFFNSSLYFDNGAHGEDVPSLLPALYKDLEKLVSTFCLNI